MRQFTGTTPTPVTASLRAPTVGSAELTGLAPTRLLAVIRVPEVASVAVSSVAPTVSVASGEVQDTERLPLVGDLLWTGLLASRVENHIRTIRIRGG